MSSEAVSKPSSVMPETVLPGKIRRASSGGESGWSELVMGWNAAKGKAAAGRRLAVGGRKRK